MASDVYSAGVIPEGADTLRKFSSVKYQKPKLHKPHLCPVCGTDDTEQSHYERRCNNDNCEVLTYIPRT